MWYESSERCVCKCGYEDVAENIDMDPHLLCVRCPKCNELMSVIEDEQNFKYEREVLGL